MSMCCCSTNVFFLQVTKSLSLQRKTLDLCFQTQHCVSDPLSYFTQGSFLLLSLAILGFRPEVRIRKKKIFYMKKTNVCATKRYLTSAECDEVELSPVFSM